MKRDIDLFLGKVSKIIKGKNFLYCVCKKGYSFEFIVAAKRLQSQKPDSLIFVRHGNRFTFRDEFEGLNFKGLLIYGSLSKLIKSDLLNIRLFLQTYLMENAKTERLKKLIKKYEEYKK